MRRGLLGALVGALLLTGCATGAGAVDVNNGGEFRFVQGTPAGEVIPSGERAAAPEFSGTLLGGGRFESTELAGDVAVLNFWGSWCAPCRVETPQFQEVYDEVRDDGVQFLGLNVKDAEQLAAAFLESKAITFPSLFDPTGEGQVDVANGGEFRFVQGTPAGQVIPADERAAAPEFSGTLLGGGEFASAELAGDVAVLNFWGSWCPPCRVETPEFQQVYSDVQGDGVHFVGINVKDDKQLADAFLQSKGITFPSLYDPRGEVALAFRDYPATAIPSTIVLDRESRVAAVYTGEVRQDDLRTVLAELTGEA